MSLRFDCCFVPWPLSLVGRSPAPVWWVRSGKSLPAFSVSREGVAVADSSATTSTL
ncbi:hypothetical protein [Synechococcus sp. ROS8604]|uniref:hypothetical protein n=1 Tax=Synechococcus sp. ROS8604 TaxID=1442557 RepID=UPI001646EB36|nr:hypothetical protein [Synechococcus sp. ROS8604]